MIKTRLTWATLGLIYLVFFSWYTSFKGPLSEAEVDHYVALLRKANPDRSPEREAILRKFLETDTGDDFVMWNNIEMYETPLRVEGVEAGESSADVLAKYMEFMLPELLARACHPVVMGTAASPALEMFGMEGARNWTTGAGMRYRSRRDMIEIATNPAFQGSHAFKTAAILKTFAFPIDPWFQLGDPRLVLALAFLVAGLGISWLEARS